MCCLDKTVIKFCQRLQIIKKRACKSGKELSWIMQTQRFKCKQRSNVCNVLLFRISNSIFHVQATLACHETFCLILNVNTLLATTNDEISNLFWFLSSVFGVTMFFSIYFLFFGVILKTNKLLMSMKKHRTKVETWDISLDWLFIYGLDHCACTEYNIIHVVKEFIGISAWWFWFNPDLEKVFNVPRILNLPLSNVPQTMTTCYVIIHCHTDRQNINSSKNISAGGVLLRNNILLAPHE